MSDAAVCVTPAAYAQLSARVAWLEELHGAGRTERSLKDALADIRARLSQLERRELGGGGTHLGDGGVVPALPRDMQGRSFHHWLGDYVEGDDA